MLLLSFAVMVTSVAEAAAAEVKVYLEESTASQTQPGLAKHEPAWGAFIGGTIDRDPAVNDDLSRVRAAYGKEYAIVLVYAQWGELLPVLSTRAAAEADAALQVAWEPSYGLEAVNDDGYVREFARALNDYSNPVFLRFASEMNGDWVPWTGNPALYIEKFRLISQIMREEAPNVAMVWSPNCVPTKNIDQYYPGDQYVDWVGVSGYSDYYFIGNPASKESVAQNFFQGKNAQPLSKFDYVYQQYASRKPIMISETGVAWANRNPYEVVAGWGAEHLKRLYRELPVLYPRIKAVCYFNVDLMSNPQIAGHSHYLLSGNPLMQQAFREVIASPWYLDSWKKTSPIRYTLLQGPLPAGFVQLAAAANLGSAGASRVEYSVNGAVIGSASQEPWMFSGDLSPYAGAELVVKAFDKAGKLGATNRYPISKAVQPPIQVELNGRNLNFDVPPIIVDDRVLVPARAVLEAMGATLQWEEATKTVKAEKDGQILKLQINNPKATLNGLPLPEMDVPGRIINGRTLLPLRFVSQTYQMQVEWDAKTRKVTINN
jgi:hypothetical protein